MSIDVDRIQKSVRKVRKFVKKAPLDPAPEQVHDLRTHARKLESSLHALSMDSTRDERRLLKSVKQIRKRAGKVRDMDVLTGHVCGVKVAGEQDCEVQLLEHLGAQRHKNARKLHATVLKERPSLKKRLQREAAELDRLIQDSRPDEASAQAAAHALELTSELSDPPRLNKGNLHSYRLKVKELRYVLQMAESNGQKAFVKQLGEVKDAIGEWHDWEELIAIGGDVLDHSAGCRLVLKFKQISEAKYERALTLANRLRRAYLKKADLKKPRNSGAGQRFGRPVLVATSALTSGTQKQAA